MARSSGNDFDLAAALLPAAAVLFGAYRLAEARACAEEGVIVARRSGSPTQLGMSTNLLAVMLFDDDPGRARALLREGLDASEHPSVGHMRASGLLRLARLDHTVDDPEWARAFRPSVAGVQDAGDRRSSMMLLELYSRALAEAGHFELAGILRWALPAGTMVVGNLSDAEQLATENQICRALGDDRSTELRARAAAMDIDDALSLALAELDRVDRGGLITTADETSHSGGHSAQIPRDVRRRRLRRRPRAARRVARRGGGVGARRVRALATRAVALRCRRGCMHRGDTVRLSFAAVTFTGAVVGVGTDILCLATVATERVDVALGSDASFVLRVVPARGGGGRGDGTVTTFRARLRELDGSRVDVGLRNGSALTGVLHAGVDHVQTVDDDGARAYAPTGSVCWVRPVDVD